MRRVYTKHGLRAHFTDGRTFLGEDRSRTIGCYEPVYELHERSRLFQHRLAQASICSRCEQVREMVESA